MGLPEDGFRWHSGLEVTTGDLGGWGPGVHFMIVHFVFGTKFILPIMG
jgi:hypothetical protein